MTIRVLVVDDSAFARKVLVQILSQADGIEVVGIARDGLDALEKIRLLAPDVMTLDLAMPMHDGLAVLASMPQADTPRVVVVTCADDDHHTVVAALQAGAVALVHKPTAIASDQLFEMSEELVEAVRRAAAARWTVVPPVPRSQVEAIGSGRTGLVVMGASTGGPQALTHVLTALPASFPAAICVVLHMPVGYTEAFAHRLDDQCALEVLEGEDGMLLRPGLVIVARAGVHLTIRKGLGPAAVRLSSLPLDCPHRPSVDVLFASAARAVGAGVLGVVFTGMGEDGLVGSGAIVAAGGRVITQSAQSCVVYGMPRAVAEAGLSEEAIDLASIPQALLLRI